MKKKYALISILMASAVLLTGCSSLASPEGQKMVDHAKTLNGVTKASFTTGLTGGFPHPEAIVAITVKDDISSAEAAAVQADLISFDGSAKFEHLVTSHLVYRGIDIPLSTKAPYVNLILTAGKDARVTGGYFTPSYRTLNLATSKENLLALAATVATYDVSVLDPETIISVSADNEAFSLDATKPGLVSAAAKLIPNQHIIGLELKNYYSSIDVDSNAAILEVKTLVAASGLVLPTEIRYLVNGKVPSP